MAERFWANVHKTDGCWLWVGWSDRLGYGRFYVNGDAPFQGRMVASHRFAYEQARGTVPDGLVLDHLCRTPRCVRPDHLEPVTQAENVRRGDNFWRKRTHCANGHEFSDENTCWRRTPSGGRRRVCLACNRATAMRRRSERKMEVG